MAVALIIILYIINGISWFFLFSHLKKMFSADGVIENVQLKLNTLLIQIDSATDRNIKLINERIKDLKFLSAEADNKIVVLQEKINVLKKNDILNKEAEHTERSKNFEEKVYADVKRDASKKYSPVLAYQKEQMSYHASAGGSEGSSVFVQEYSNPVGIDDQRQMEVKKNENIESIPEVSLANELVKPKKEFKTVVHELRNLGYTVEEIAAETGKSTQEVKIIL
ncbi:MAG: hypothetical protein IJ828_03820, partial [Treponema sp.]|nr:hypothetical protein [Treponema sp.]